VAKHVHDLSKEGHLAVKIVHGYIFLGPLRLGLQKVIGQSMAGASRVAYAFADCLARYTREKRKYTFCMLKNTQPSQK
jgi:hypothetical protein